MARIALLTAVTPVLALNASADAGADPIEWCRSLEAGNEADDGWLHGEHLELEGSPPVFKCPPPFGSWIWQSDAVAMPLRGTHKYFLTLYRRQLFGDRSPSFAFIQLHGALLDGDFYFRQAVKAVPLVVNHENAVTRGKSAVVITPQFGNRACSEAEWLNNNGGRQAARWHAAGWFYGMKAFREKGWRGISAFEALDQVVEWSEKQYPNLERVIVMGFSAGAMMAVRWAVLSEQGKDGKTFNGTPLQIIAGSPSSELYLDDKRPKKSCLFRKNSGDARFLCQKYLKPTGSKSAANTCTGTWNKYPFGLEDVDDFLRAPYIGNLSAADIRLRFAGKDFWIGVGDRDWVPCLVGGCQRDCPALSTGATRLQRVLNFVHHLEDAIPGYKPKYQVFAGGHAHFHMLCGQTSRPSAGTSYFQNAFNHGDTARDRFSCSVKVLENLGLNGNNIAQTVAVTSTECCDYCDQTPGCVAWNFAPKWQQCQLMSDVRGQWPTTDFVSGRKDTLNTSLTSLLV